MEIAKVMPNDTLKTFSYPSPLAFLPATIGNIVPTIGETAKNIIFPRVERAAYMPASNAGKKCFTSIKSVVKREVKENA